jgi:hypothetical protein
VPTGAAGSKALFVQSVDSRGSVLAAPVTLQTGFAWNGATRTDNLRHACHHHHKLQDWGWRAHDGRSYGYQFLGDKENNVVRDCSCAWPDAGTDVILRQPLISGGRLSPLTPQNLTVEFVQPDRVGADSSKPLPAGCRPWTMSIGGTAVRKAKKKAPAGSGRTSRRSRCSPTSPPRWAI